MKIKEKKNNNNTQYNNTYHTYTYKSVNVLCRYEFKKQKFITKTSMNTKSNFLRIIMYKYLLWKTI